MAKRRTRTVYRTARKFYRSRKGILGGSFNNILWGAIGGAVSGLIPNNLPVVGKWGKPVILGAGGWILKKPALMTCAGYEIGKSIMGGMSGGSNGSFLSFFES